MPRPAKHVFVCVQSRPPGHPRGSCGAKGCQAVFDELLSQSQSRELAAQGIQVTGTGCLSPCDSGPNLLVYPEGVMYGGLKKEDVAEIIDSHLLGGKPVERLLVPSEIW